MSDEDVVVTKKILDAPTRRRPKKLFIPKRAPSVVIPGSRIVYTTPDKTTCAECTCFPKEDPYVKPKNLNPCQKSPRTLYELAAAVVDGLAFPEAFEWTEEEVADWMEYIVGFPQYRKCILDNHINGMRLMMLEDPSKLPEINIHYFKHIKVIVSKVREEFSLEYIRFARSICLPPRKPFTHFTWFKSRTGPSWGIRQNWTRSDILRWMKVLMPKPVNMDHWDLVWYQKPDFPKVMFARMRKPDSQVHIPRYKPVKEEISEYQVIRKFRIQQGIPEAMQLIWMERGPEYEAFDHEQKRRKEMEMGKKRVVKFVMPEGSHLYPEKVSTEGLKGKDLILARRKRAREKFLA